MVFCSVFSCIERIQKRRVILDMYHILVTSKCTRNSFHLLLARKVKKKLFSITDQLYEIIERYFKINSQKDNEMAWHNIWLSHILRKWLVILNQIQTKIKRIKIKSKPWCMYDFRNRNYNNKHKSSLNFSPFKMQFGFATCSLTILDIKDKHTVQSVFSDETIDGRMQLYRWLIIIFSKMCSPSLNLRPLKP